MSYTEQYAIDMVKLVGKKGPLFVNVGIENHKIVIANPKNWKANIRKRDVLNFIAELEDFICQGEKYDKYHLAYDGLVKKSGEYFIQWDC